GNGYVEESGLPRLLRESPLNSIWGGSGSVTAPAVVRPVARGPAAGGAAVPERAAAAGGAARPRGAPRRLRSRAAAAPASADAPRVATRLALALQASVLVRHAPAPVADAFCATRLPDGPPALFGTTVPDPTALVDRAAPTR